MNTKFTYKCFLFICFFIVIVTIGKSETLYKRDELKKYSYLIYAIGGQFKYSATGFFIKRDNRLFLVGAGHTFSGKNSITGVNDNDLPDTISVIICRECENDSGIIHIDISQIKKMPQPSTFAVKPDIYVYEIKDKLPFKVNSIEKFIKNFDNSDKNLIDSVFMYGYPSLTGNSIDDYKQISPTLSFGYLLEKYTVFNYYPEINTYDKINYLMKPNDSSPIGGGFSGSPCFFDVKGKYYFGGVCIGGSINKRLIINVRSEQIIKLFN